MKMLEPVGYLSQYNLTMLEQGYPQTIVMLKGAKRDLPLYDKQALIDLLEAAAVECDQERVAHLMFKNYQAAMALANVADSIRSTKEKL